MYKDFILKNKDIDILKFRIEDSLYGDYELTILERYNDEFLEKAEIRRKALQYKRMHVGLINSDRMEHMIKLLYQVHQNYYLGYFEASCTLAGSMLIIS